MLADLLEKTGDANGAKLERSTLRGARPTAPATDPWLDQISLQSYDAYRMQAFGALRIDGGKPAEAMPFLQRALALDPGDIDAVELVAKNALALGRPEEAEATLRRGLQISPDNERLTASLIDVLAAEKNTALAAGAIDSLAKVVREKPLVQIAVGKAYLSLGRPRDALEAFQSALRADPVSFEAQANVGRALLKINRQTEARDALRHAHKMRPEDYGVLGLLAALELELRDLDAAWEHAKELLAMDPNQPEARKLVSDIGLQYGNALSQAGKLTEAETAYREALMLNDNSPALHGALGMIYGKRRRFTEAEREFARYVQLAPNEALGYVFLGSVYSSTGRRDEAISIWKKGLAVARQNADMPRANQLDALLKSVE
ncbi:MAG TPA: tetratricopeptide repeat protein [Opitutaceae bacterium]|nr:tetratricopeptide repeat protein [Opitutaceae bacterium]